MTSGRIGMGDVNPYDGLEEDYTVNQAESEEEIHRNLEAIVGMVNRVQRRIENVNTDDELEDIDDKLQHIGMRARELHGLSGGRRWDYRNISSSNDIDRALYQMASYYGFDPSSLHSRFWHEYDSGKLADIHLKQRALAVFEVEMLAEEGMLPR